MSPRVKKWGDTSPVFPTKLRPYIDMGRVLHSTTVAGNTIGRVSSQMNKNL